MVELEYRGFYDDLKEIVRKESGVYEKIVRYCPELFKLLCNILVDKRLNESGHKFSDMKLIISATLGYFVVPNDVIPEDELGAIGFIDDVFLCAYTLRRVKSVIGEKIILDNYHGKEDIMEIINDLFYKTKKIIGEDTKHKVCRFVGLE